VPPPGLRARVLDASRRARPLGTTVPAIPMISPDAAFDHAVEAFDRTLCALTDGDWRQPAIRDLDVQGLVGHLIGVEDHVRRAIERDPDVANTDHVASTQETAVRQAGRPPELTLEDWRRAIGRTKEALASEPSRETDIGVHGVRLPLSAVLIFRAFELWTHENDIRLAAGLPLSAPGPSSLFLMCRLALSMLPYAALATGLRPVQLHLVLTGLGGGTWDIPLGTPASADPAARESANGQHEAGHQEANHQETGQASIVTDVVDWCRLAANRMRPAELDHYVTGSADLATGILEATAALALD
jgi:uncharacterized protein (TIGR03083 family)